MKNLINSKHYVIIIPGLGDNYSGIQIKLIKLALKIWRGQRLEPIIHIVGWRDKRIDFSAKLKKLIALIDDLHNQGHAVSVVGYSAGGGFALNAFYERRGIIKGAVSICGRLRDGGHKGFRSLKLRSIVSPAFLQSVRMWESREPDLTEAERARIMTVSALWDQLAPRDTTSVVGAHNLIFPTVGHITTGAMALAVLSKPVIKFLKG